MSDVLVKNFGWRATMLHGDPCVADRWRFASRHLPQGPLRTLDAGAGNGSFSLLAASRGHDVLGLSFDEGELNKASEFAAAAGLRNARFRTLDLRELERHAASLGTFDRIICLEVLEHLKEDQLVLGQLAALLRPGGQIIVSVPSNDHLPLVGEKLDVDEQGGHVRWGYPSSRLRDMASTEGLVVVSTGAVSGWVSQTLTDLMRLGSRVSTVAAWAVVFPLRPLQLLDRLVSRLTRTPYLSRTIVLARP